MSGPVDVLAGYAQDTGAFRVSNKGATELAAACAAVAELIAANKNLIRIIESAGLINLSTGVQLGQVSWYAKASDAMEWNVGALARVGGES